MKKQIKQKESRIKDSFNIEVTTAFVSAFIVTGAVFALIFIFNTFVAKTNMGRLVSIVYLPLAIIGLFLCIFGLLLLTYKVAVKKSIKRGEKRLNLNIEKKLELLSKYSKIENQELTDQAYTIVSKGYPFRKKLSIALYSVGLILCGALAFVFLMKSASVSVVIAVEGLVLGLAFFLINKKMAKQMKPLLEFMNLEEEYRGTLGANFTIKQIDISNVATKNTSGLDLSIAVFNTVFIYNENEEQKATIADTLSLNVKPCSGQIYINGQNSIQIIKNEILLKTCVLDSTKFKDLVKNNINKNSDEEKAKIEYANFKVNNSFDKLKDVKTKEEIISAVYKDADVYIINSIFDSLKEPEFLGATRAIEEMLPDKIFIFLTSKAYNFSSSNNVIVYEDGKVKSSGSFAEIVKKSHQFIKFKTEENKKANKK